MGRGSSSAAPTAAGRSSTRSDEGLSHVEAGRRLGISQSAVSQRAQTAGLVDGRRARGLAGHLLAALLAGPTGSTPRNTKEVPPMNLLVALLLGC